MAHRFRGVSFAETVLIEEPTVEDTEETNDGNKSPKEDTVGEMKSPLFRGKRVRRFTEQTPQISDDDYRKMSFFQEKPRSMTRPNIFGDDNIGDLNAAKLLSTLTLTTNSKMAGYIEETKRRASTIRPRGPTFMERSLLETTYESYEEIGRPEIGSSMLLTIWNLLPLLQGSSVFSMPYTIISGGYLALLLIPFISVMASFTGTILIDCMYEISPNSKVRKRIRKDYVAVARAVWGNNGARVVNAILVFYLFTGDVVNIVLLARSVYEILSPVTDLSFGVLTSIFAILCYPTLFITRLTILAYLSFLSVLSVVIAILASLIVFFTEANTWNQNINNIEILNIEGLPLAASIVMFSCLTHSVLPRVESDMARPSKANKAIFISYTVSAITKTVVAFFGAVTFGNATNSIVTLNVGETNSIARYVCAVALIGFSVLNYPLNLFVVCENVDALIENSKCFKKNNYYYPWLLITRLILVSLTVVVALVVPYFGLLLAIRGSLIGTCLIFVFPCVFHLYLKWSILSPYQKTRDFVLLFIGTMIGLFGLYSSIDRLIAAIKEQI